MVEESTSTTKEAVAPAGPFHLDIHSWIENSQTTHGVRHEDYNQYSKYCTNRLKRLSHSTPEVKKFLVCSSKYATTKPTTEQQPATTPTATSGGGKSKSGGSKQPRHAYVSRKSEILEAFTATTSSDDEKPQPLPHENILWYHLVQSERSWANAKLKRHQQSSDGPSQKSQILSKYKKAKDYAQILVGIASASDENVDATTLQECHCYLAWMNGNYALEKLDYKVAIEEFATAMTLCHQLSQTSVLGRNGGTDRNDTRQLERQDLFLTRADTLLRPLFRYCQYELKQAGESIPVDEPQLSGGTSAATKPQDGDDDIAVNFRGFDLIVENKDLRVLMLKYQSLSEQQQQQVSSSNSQEKGFLELLSVVDDATEVVSKELQSYEKATVVGPTIQAKISNLKAWKGYLQYQKTYHVMNHTEELLADIEGHAERVHVYDALLQHANTLLALPKVRASIDGEDTADDSEEDEFALQVQANCLRLRAFKCYHMGWYYYTSSKKFGAALSLLELAAKLRKRAIEEIAACDEEMPNGDKYMEELESLPLKGSIAGVKSALALQQGLVSEDAAAAAAAMTATKTTNRPLLLRLNEPDNGLVMAEITPMPIFAKPIFFDIAYDYAMDTRDSIDVIQDFVEEHTINPDAYAGDETKDGEESGGSGCLVS